MKGEFDRLLSELAKVYVEGVGRAQGKGPSRRLREVDIEGVWNGLGEVERRHIERLYGTLERKGGQKRGWGARGCEIL